MNKSLRDMIDAVKASDDSEKCKGRFYRVRKNAYKSDRRIFMSTSLIELKRMSCPGCKRCAWIDDDVHEGLCDMGDAYIEGLNSVKDGDIVRLLFILDSTDWETGLVDSWHLKAVKCQPEDAAK